jgi:hypothetical protein
MWNACAQVAMRESDDMDLARELARLKVGFYCQLQSKLSYLLANNRCTAHCNLQLFLNA